MQGGGWTGCCRRSVDIVCGNGTTRAGGDSSSDSNDSTNYYDVLYESGSEDDESEEMDVLAFCVKISPHCSWT